jgi:hypothetical protein
MWLFIHRPFEVWPVLGDFRVELIYMLVTIAAWVFHPGKQWPSSPANLGILGFIVAVLICWLASDWFGDSSYTIEKYLKLSVFYFLLVTTVYQERQLRLICAAFLVIMAGYMLHSLLEYHNGRHEYRMGIVRMVGVDQTVNDPNAFAASIVYALPLVTVFWSLSPSNKQRILLAGYVGLSAWCIILTGSRSGFVGLILASVITIVSHHLRWRLCVLGLICAPILWAGIPDSLQNRFETIVDPDAGPANAQESAMGRIEGFKNGVALLEKYPLTGSGPGAWKQGTGTSFESHNLYGQVMGEMGLVGCVAFAVMIGNLAVTIVRILLWAQQQADQSATFLRALAKSLALALGLMLVEGNFSHNLFRYNWLWYGAFLVAMDQIVKNRWTEARFVVTRI